MKAAAVLLLSAAALQAAAGDAEVRVATLDDSAATGCTRCAAGDFRIDNGALEMVVGASHRRDESFYRFPTADALGSIVSLRAAGSEARGDIMLGTPYVRIGNTTRHVVYDDVDLKREGGRVTVTAGGRFDGGPGALVRFETRYSIRPGADRVDVSLTASNAGTSTIDGFIYSLFFDPHQVYDFSPADVEAHGDIPFRGYPRGRHLTGWIDRTPRVPTDSDNEWGWDGGMILPDPVAVSLAPGASESRNYTVVAAAEPRRVLAEGLSELGVAARPVSFRFASESSDYFELVVRETKTAALFYRAFLDRPAPLTLALPDGEYTAQANFFPGSARCRLTVSRAGNAGCRLEDPPRGMVTVSLLDAAGRPVPGKVSFHGLDGTAMPYFRPANPGRDDGYWESAKNSVFPVRAALAVGLPAGDYRVSASRGPEYSIDERTVRVAVGESRALVLTVDRIVERPDLVSMDPHLHTLESDGAVDVAEKIRALVAEGIDVAVATDHNFPVDYRPALRALGLEGELAVVAGAEMTIPERLDYNSYPMDVRPDEYNHGAIDALSTDLSGRFAASRARDRHVILQVNHPRLWQFDYFNWHALDPVSAAFANEGFDLTFDVLEVVNGANYDDANNRATRRDWFNLMRRGWFFPLVGTSDSHEIDQDEPGYSRTWIYREDNDRAPRDSATDVSRLMERVRGGHSFASNGPLLDLTVAGRYRPGETFRAAGSRVPVRIEVTSAPWIEVNAARLYVNGVPREVAMQRVARSPASGWRADLELQLDSDAFLVAEATGEKDLSPVVQRRVAADGSEMPIRPYALTNPVFVDVDGNGRYDPPLPHEIALRPTGTP